MIAALIGAPAALAEEASVPDVTTQSVVTADTSPSKDVVPVETPTVQPPVVEATSTETPVVTAMDVKTPSDPATASLALAPKPTVQSVVQTSNNKKTVKKVFVCKYVGTPGVDERLQTGQNPISVSVNAIQHNQWDGTVPGYFSDAHDRSYVLAYDTGQAKPNVSACPTPVGPPPAVKKQEVGIYFYPLLDSSKAPSWENSGKQTFCQSKDGTDYFTSISCILPPEVCGTGWGYQQDKVKDWAYAGAFKWPTNIQYPVDNIGWPPIYASQHGLLSALTTVPPCAPPPPTATQCTATNSYLVTNLDEQGFNYTPTGTPYADTRANGHYKYVPNALRMYTDNNSGLAKVQAARAVNIPVANYGGTFSLNQTLTTGTIKVGINVRFTDGGQTFTATAEPGVPGYNQLWSNTPGWLPYTANGPNDNNGQGGQYSGDIDDIVASHPNATVTVEALSDGSGVYNDALITSWSTPCNTYTYDYVAPPIVVAPSATITSVCAVDGGSNVSVKLVAGTNDTTFQILVNGDQVKQELVKAGKTFTYETTLAEDSSSGSAAVQVKSGKIDVTDVVTVSTDCLPPVTIVVAPPAPKANVPTCDADGSLPALTDGTGYTAAYNRAFDGPGTYTAVYTADKGSAFSTGATVSYDLTVGAKLTENCATTVTHTTPPKSLPFTGVDIGGSVIAIFALLFSGLMLINPTRRRILALVRRIARRPIAE